MAKVAQYEGERNVAGLLQELGSDVQGRTKYGIPRADAALALGRLRELSAVPNLCQLATDDPEPMARMCAVHALGVMRAKESEETLLACLSDPDPLPRMAAAAALGRMGARGAAPRLREVLDRDPDVEVRFSAVEALVILGDRQSRERVPAAISALSRLRRSSSGVKRLKEAVENDQPLSPRIMPWE